MIIKEQIYIDNILKHIPGCIYWKDKNGVYLGCNRMEAEMVGFTSPEQVIGKTDYALSWKCIADVLRETDTRIMRTGIPEEIIEAPTLADGRQIMMLTKKSPLYDNENNVIGIIGVSLDMTDRIKAEQLEIRNELQKIKIEEQEEFRKFTARVAHDIASPLTSLEHFAKCCEGLSDHYYATLISIIKSIKNIANDLLSKYMQDCHNAYSEQEQYILLSLALQELISHKKYQYRKSQIKLNYFYNPAMKLTFIKCDQSNFSRMISNAINNAIEALENESGTIDISFGIEDQTVKITIKDDGKGMSKEFVDKINNYFPIGTTKTDGHGLGFGQIVNTVKLYNGKLFVESTEGKGTTLIITFPVAEHPEWIADSVKLRKGNIVIVVDDDSVTLDLWKTLLQKHAQSLQLAFFTDCNEAFSFIESIEDKNNLLLLADLKLQSGNLNGLYMILQNDLQGRVLLVTSTQSDKMIHDFVLQSRVKILPKLFISDIPIVVE
ncbi:MAG: PAS domain-containing sensor histidine kinase [Holosporaceae bacterium]|jgi:PAS domain S-box-containing protein|nr:PAS domain-containing sensor histidine kinase [Holosporaceae bacterium]